jgi:ATP-dependent RNA helicase DHX57
VLILRQGFALYGGDPCSIVNEEVISQVSTQLETLGFQEPQIKKARLFLSQRSSLLGRLLQTLQPFEAATEYLLLHIPECDMPSRFLPVNNSSNSFISTAYSGNSDVKKRWLEDRAAKEAGWPIHVVQEITSDSDILPDWPLLLVRLGNRLLGLRDKESQDQPLQPFTFDEDEILALGATRIDDGHYALPALVAPLTLHLFTDTSRQYPRPFYSPMFITSTQVPPYIRLHILSCILSVVNRIPLSEELEGSFALTLITVMDEEWARLEDDGPPDISIVMANMLPERKTVDAPAVTQIQKERAPVSMNRSLPRSPRLTSRQGVKTVVSQRYQKYRRRCTHLY